MTSSTSSRFGLAAIIASIGLPLAQLFAPLLQEIHISREQVKATALIEEVKHKEQVAKLVLDSYLNQSAEKQKATLAILGVFFEEYMGDTALQKVLSGNAVDPSVNEKVDLVVATAGQVPPSKLSMARSAENAGFEALLKRDIVAARTEFSKAFAAYPTYHNVDEINALLKSVDHKNPASVEDALERIATQYTWGNEGFAKKYKAQHNDISYSPNGTLWNAAAGITVRMQDNQEVLGKWRVHIQSNDSLITSGANPAFYGSIAALWDMDDRESFYVKNKGTWYRFYLDREPDTAGEAFKSWRLVVEPGIPPKRM